MTRIRRTSPLKGLKVKHVGYYNVPSQMKEETCFPDMAKQLLPKIESLDFEGPKDKVHIFQTNRSFLIGYQSGKVRVSNVQLNSILTFTKDGKWQDL